MYFLIDTRKVVEVFCAIADFCLELKEYFASHPLPAGLEPRHPAGCKASLSESEVLTILVLYHLSGFKCFAYYYQRLVLGELKSYFPRAVSYTHFLELARQALLHAFLLAHYRAGRSQRSEHYYIDSKKLPVCDNRRIHSHKVFEEVASRGRGSTGWFFGLKLHLVTNEHQELVRFLITPANVADNNPRSAFFPAFRAQRQVLRG